ncbi:hypothetical protein [Acetobacterium bakii]|uniref:Molybdopterin cofactor biosynthesis MoaD-related C-terminal domain-containing protein n=1 Tax=Acetobacterium bakii TaxID=52689 RepID=A0A0L6U1H7_9FIRM|nr:hypothetical protein [Acetobacterium bakii]KNZ42349.1 hypothetical protein AKG39_06855 [Acetobacterium bakii]
MKDQEIKTREINNQLKQGKAIIAKKIQTRSIPKRSFERYFKEKGKEVVGDIYYGDGWKVSLSEERQEKVGCCFIVAVDVTMEVEAEIFDDFLMTYRKNFLRGGA